MGLCVYLLVTLPHLIKQLEFNPGGSNLMTLLNPNHLPKALPLNTMLKSNSHFLNISKWGLNSTMTFGGHKSHSTLEVASA
jgi:hypothetical protein